MCCLRMTALRPVIVVRSSVQKPATSARRDSARIDRPATAGIVLARVERLQQPPEAAVPAGSTAGRPGHKVWQMPATAQQAPHPQADNSFAAHDLLDRSPNEILLKKPFRAIILPQHRIPRQKRIRGLLRQVLRHRSADCRTCERCRLLDTRSHDDHRTKCRHS